MGTTSMSMGMVSSLDSNINVSSELFTDLDPLGTGKSRPYVDKKDFFSELKSSSPKLGNMSSAESPVPMTLSSSMEATTNSNIAVPSAVSTQANNAPVVAGSTAALLDGLFEFLKEKIFVKRKQKSADE